MVNNLSTAHPIKILKQPTTHDSCFFTRSWLTLTRSFIICEKPEPNSPLSDWAFSENLSINYKNMFFFVLQIFLFVSILHYRFLSRYSTPFSQRYLFQKSSSQIFCCVRLFFLIQQYPEGRRFKTVFKQTFTKTFEFNI